MQLLVAIQRGLSRDTYLKHVRQFRGHSVEKSGLATEFYLDWSILAGALSSYTNLELMLHAVPLVLVPVAHFQLLLMLWPWN
jgi:hypothetical protein